MLLTAAHLLPHPFVSAALGLGGAVAGPSLARFAARRTVAQPLSLALEDEVVLLTGVLAEVRRLPYLTSLSATDFAAGAHARIWQALLDAAPECVLPEDVSDEQCESVGLALDARREEFLGAVRALLAAGAAPVGDAARLRELLAAQSAFDDARVVEAGQAVMFAGSDRNRLAGAGLVLPTSTPDSASPQSPPLHRVHVAPSRLRIVTTTAATAFTALLLPAMVSDTGFGGIAALSAGAALLALLVLSVVISLVDLDTFFIDVRLFAATGAAAWAFTLGAVAVTGTWGRLLSGLLLVAGAVAVFEGGNRLHRLVRGEDGQGFGDTLIILATAGVPATLDGSWALGYYSVMAGMLAGVGGWVLGRVRGRLTRTTPYAFGPYLAAGWVLGWLIVLLCGGSR